MSESSLSTVTVGQPVLGVFVVYNYLHQPVTGLTQGSFTALLSTEGAASSEPITITEMSYGRYLYSFTPTTVGQWYILIKHATYNPRGWDDEFIAEERTATGSTWPYTQDYLRRTRDEYERHFREMRKRQDLDDEDALIAILLALED